MQVLIIDSSVEIIGRLEEILIEEKSIRMISTAISYKEAMKILNENKTDIVLLDCSLPGNGSLEILKEIKKPGSNISVILLSLETDNRKKEQCRLLGVDFFFDKYYDFEKIPNAIKTIATEKKAIN